MKNREKSCKMVITREKSNTCNDTFEIGKAKLLLSPDTSFFKAIRTKNDYPPLSCFTVFYRVDPAPPPPAFSQKKRTRDQPGQRGTIRDNRARWKSRRRGDESLTSFLMTGPARRPFPILHSFLFLLPFHLSSRLAPVRKAPRASRLRPSPRLISHSHF